MQEIKSIKFFRELGKYRQTDIKNKVFESSL